MAYNNVEIFCRILQWDATVEYKKRSIFNTVENPPSVGKTVDLMPYCMELGELSFNTIGDSIAEEINSLFYEAGNVRLKLSGIKNNKFIQNYFALFNINGILAYRQYAVEIRFNGQTIFAGVVTQDSIVENFRNGNDNEIVGIQITGLEKEFKEYYSNKDLADHGTVFNQSNNDTYALGWNGDSRSEDNGINGAGLCRAKALRGVLAQNFNTNNLIINSSLVDKWHVNNIPQFHYNSAYNNRPWFIRSGYKRFQQENYSIYELFDKICNSMGFEWYIRRRPFTPSNQFRYEIVIENRKDITNGVTELEYKLLEFDLGYKINKTDFEYLIIPDGNISSNGFYHTAGNSYKMSTLKLPYIVNNSNFFFNVTGDPNGYQLYPLPSPQKYAIENAKAEEKFRWAEVEYNGSPNWDDNRIVNKKFIKSDKIVYLDGGDHNEMRTVVDTSNGINYPATSMGESDTDIIFSGCCGSMLFRYSNDNIGTQSLGLDYNDYTQGATFKENFKTLVNNLSNNTVTIKYKGALTDPKKGIKIVNSHKEFFNNSIFRITDLKLDLVNEISTITLVRT